ncbi:MAG: hypothetical protein BroJett003_19240 [Planctomycetota bacterium]|nr:MAG: hypothetical protein BroJett003_19240 [Planctomycetota bacterium]
MKAGWHKCGLRSIKALACGAMLMQAASCQTTAQELFAGLVSAGVTNIINSLVFSAFGLP